MNHTYVTMCYDVPSPAEDTLTKFLELTFVQDMTEVERKIMQEHGDYWKDLSDRRIEIIFGPEITRCYLSSSVQFR